MRKRINKYVLLFLTIIISINMTFISNADILDDLFKAIGIVKENESLIDETIEKEIEEKLTTNQKEVVAKVDEIYNDLIELNIDGVLNNINYSVPNYLKKNVEDFLAEYPNSKKTIKNILGSIKYKIENVEEKNDTVIVKITYQYPDMENIVKDSMFSIFINNAPDILSGNIDNDTLDSMLVTLNKTFEKKKTFLTNTYDFKFKKIGDDWKLIEVDDIEKKITNYVNNTINSVLGKDA